MHERCVLFDKKVKTLARQFTSFVTNGQQIVRILRLTAKLPIKSRVFDWFYAAMNKPAHWAVPLRTNLHFIGLIIALESIATEATQVL